MLISSSPRTRHPAASLKQIELKRLHHSECWKILTVVGDKLNVELQHEALVGVGRMRDGFQHYVHLIGEALFSSIYDDPQEVKR